MKTLRFKRSSDAIRTEHPDGGTFYIRPLSFDQAVSYAELVTKQEFERDEAGKIVHNQLTGQPVKKYAGEPHDHIDFAIELLDRVEDLEIDTGDAVITTLRADDGSTREILVDVLTLLGTDEFEVEVGIDKDGKELDASKLKPEEYDARKVDTKKVMKKQSDNYFVWITKKSALYAQQRNEAARGN